MIMKSDKRNIKLACLMTYILVTLGLLLIILVEFKQHDHVCQTSKRGPLSCKMRLRATLPPLSPDLDILMMIMFSVILIMNDKKASTMTRMVASTVRSTCASCCSPPSPTHPWSMKTKPWKFKLDFAFADHCHCHCQLPLE